MKFFATDRKPVTMIVVYLLLLIVAIMAMFMLKHCSQTPVTVNTQTQKSKGDTIDVAIDYSPMSMYVNGDTLGGFNYDIMSCISQRSGLPVKFHPVSLEQALRGLDSGDYDMVIADVPATLDFQQRYRLSEPLYQDRQVLLQHRDSTGVAANPVKSVLDLAGRHVWVVANSPMQSRLKSLAAEIGDTIYVESDADCSSEILYMLTSIGEIDLCVINERVAKKMSADPSGRKLGDKTVALTTGVSFTQHQSWAFRKDNEPLANKIDSLIRDFKTTRSYSDLCKRYLN